MRTSQTTKLRTAGVGLAVSAVALLFGACGQASPPGVASINASSTSTTIAGGVAGNSGPATPPPAQLRAMLKFAACARKHGLTNFPDPPYGAGELQRLGYYKGSPQVDKADKECPALALASGWVESQAEIERYIKIYLQMAKCMRNHGIENFPEPNGKAQLNVSESVEEEPGYPAAAKVCGAPPRAPASYFERNSPKEAP